MSFLSEFRAFVARGNVVDMAVGIIIGTAFGKIITSLVNDVIMPPVGFFLHGIDFTYLKIILGSSAHGGEPVAIKFGAFINTLIDFLIIAIIIFFLIKGLSELKKKPEAVTKSCPECLSTIPIGAKRCGHCTSALP